MIYNTGDRVVLRRDLEIEKEYGNGLSFLEAMKGLQEGLNEITERYGMGKGGVVEYRIDGWYISHDMIDHGRTAELSSTEVKVGDTVMALSESQFGMLGKETLGKVENITNMSYGIRVRDDDNVCCFFRQEDLMKVDGDSRTQRELPEVPRLVAEYIEERKKKSASLWAVFYDCHASGQVYQWIRQNDILFAKAWIYGYEIKDEVKYRARLKVIGENIASYLRTQSASNRLENLEIGSKYISGGYQELSEFSEEELKELGLFDNPDWEIERVVENERD